MQTIALKQREIEQFVDKHEYEMETLLTKRDWLHMYKTAIKDQQLDMDHLIRRHRHHESYASDLEQGHS